MSAADITTPVDLKAAVEQVLQRAVADARQAGVAQDEHLDEVANVEQIKGSMKRHHFHPDHIDIIGGLLGPCQQAVAAAEQFANAAEAKRAAAVQADTMADRHRRLQAQGAAGRLYNAGMTETG